MDVIKLDLEEVNMTSNKNKINIPVLFIIPLRDKFKIR